MLNQLSIDNYALIDHTLISFDEGFSVITGETGAGKSILLGALGLLVGNRADVSVLRDAEKKCVVEAVFKVGKYGLEAFFEENDLDYNDECTIRREIAPSGKSRAFVNDTPVNLAVLKTLGDRLIDIHSQHQNLLLSNANFQLDVVDVVANNATNLLQYADLFNTYKKAVADLKKLKESAQKNTADLDYISFQFKQLDEAKLQPAEQGELEAEQNKLENAESIREGLGKATYLIQESEENVINALKEAANALNAITDAFPEVEAEKDRISSAMIELKDVAQELDAHLNSMEADPARLSQVNERLDLIYSLQKKHQVSSVEELIALRDKFEAQLNQINSYDEDIERLEREQKAKRDAVLKAASQISANRKKHAPELKQELELLLHSLGMPNAKLEIAFDNLEEPSENGIDKVAFLFSANKDRNLLPISSIASGGEMARVMLSLKSVLSRSTGLATIIFDEIDTGVSGDMAAKMGDIMTDMGKYMQVISITHLPQIAAKGSKHYMVYKADTETSTISHIRCLAENERVEAIAKMLSGDKITDAAMENARSLLQS
ncbi:MAG: DNA repair protein RecN [Bacteroidales bacterium]|nr:DNA repair protein RecN [Candidatus Physcocola equi]